MVQLFKHISHRLATFHGKIIYRIPKNNFMKKLKLEKIYWVLSLGLIYIASKELALWSEARGINQYLDHSPPSIEIWSSILASNGFRSLNKINQIHNIQKSLPLQNNAPKRIWVDEDYDYLIITEERNNKTHYFSRSLGIKKLKPQSWTQYSNHWKDFKRINEKITLKREQPKKKRLQFDPYQIQY